MPLMCRTQVSSRAAANCVCAVNAIEVYSSSLMHIVRRNGSLSTAGPWQGENTIDRGI